MAKLKMNEQRTSNYLLTTTRKYVRIYWIIECMFVYNEDIKMLVVIILNEYLKLSLENQVPIDIIYFSKCGEFSQRKVIVKKINSEKVVAFCYLRNQIRTFALDRVLSASWSKKLKAG